MLEPVNVLMCDPDRLLGYGITPVKLVAAKLGACHESVRPPRANPMLDFDERDLVRHPEQAGFADIDLQLRVTVKSHHPSWADHVLGPTRQTRHPRRINLTAEQREDHRVTLVLQP
jgi:hypothetical protein